jgi:hypothetical protein
MYGVLLGVQLGGAYAIKFNANEPNGKGTSTPLLHARPTAHSSSLPPQFQFPPRRPAPLYRYCTQRRRREGAAAAAAGDQRDPSQETSEEKRSLPVSRFQTHLTLVV